MATLLCIDTSSAACSAALKSGEDILCEVENVAQRHSERLLQMCELLLKRAGKTIHDVDAIGVSQGPGSFTGVRIGISVAQGIAFAADLPVIPVSSLALLAQHCYLKHGTQQVLCVSDARMNEVYFGYYAMQNGLMTAVTKDGLSIPSHIQFEKQGEWSACGNGWLEYSDELSALASNFTQIYTDVDILAEYVIPFAEACFNKQQTVNAIELEPVYLRNDVAQKAKPQ